MVHGPTKPRHARHWQSLTCGSSAPLLCRRNSAFKAVKYQYKIHTGGVPRQNVTNTRQLDASLRLKQDDGHWK